MEGDGNEGSTLMRVRWDAAENSDESQEDGKNKNWFST
jgi:hypothetical protein